MMHWVNFVIFFLCTSCIVCSQVNGQQSNPFDIIITKNTISVERSDISTSTSPIYQSSIDQLLPDTTNFVVEIDSTQSDSQTVKLPQVINENNPFNIKETSVKINEELPNLSESENKITLELEEQVKPIPKSKSNWFSKLKPKQIGDGSIDYSLNFIFWILIASLLILAVVINLKRKSFLNLYRAITNDNYLKLLQREEYNGSSFFFLLLYFLFFLNAALFLYQVLINKFEIKGYQVFLFLFAALLVIYFIRLISTFILQITFPLEKEAKQYNFTIIMFNIIVGLLLIPVNILTAYAPFGPKMIYVGLAIIALFYVLRQIRGLFIAARINGLSYFHFFIYLCTFEVAPVFWIISFVKNWYSVS